MLKFDEEHSAGHEKAKFLHFSVNNRKISAVKHFTEKPILLNFVNLSTTFCPRLLVLKSALGSSILYYCFTVIVFDSR